MAIRIRTNGKVRAHNRKRSNNSADPNKNICVLAVAKTLGVENESRYFHYTQDLVRAARTKYTVRSRMSYVKGCSVGQARPKLAEMVSEVNAIGYIVQVAGHVLFLKPNGKTIIDTAPRLRDKRKVLSVYVVYPK
jgi:hypothetical protein